jgi:hypothetical protein
MISATSKIASKARLEVTGPLLGISAAEVNPTRLFHQARPRSIRR